MNAYRHKNYLATRRQHTRPRYSSRYNIRRKYPRLYRAVRKLRRPVQLAVLCLVLVWVVDYYQRHYSFEATMRASQTSAISQVEPLEL